MTRLEQAKSNYFKIILLLLATIVAYYTSTMMLFIAFTAFAILIYYFSKIFGRKIAIKHPIFSSTLVYFNKNLFEGILALYIIYETIPEDSTFYSISLRRALVAIVVLYLTVKFAGYIEASSKHTSPNNPNHNIVFGKLAKYTIITIMFIVTLKYLNAEEEVKNIIIGAGFLSIIIGFAAQSTISNIIAGLLLLVDKPFSVGDLIEIQNTLAIVEDIRLMSTYVKTVDGKYVRIPNSTVFSENITNYKKNKIITIMQDVGISYSSDINKAKNVIMNALEKEEFVLKRPQPFIETKELGDNSVILSVWYAVPSDNFNKTKMSVLTKIYKELQKNGIEIPFPQRVNWFANDLKVKVVKEES